MNRKDYDKKFFDGLSDWDEDNNKFEKRLAYLCGVYDNYQYMLNLQSEDKRIIWALTSVEQMISDGLDVLYTGTVAEQDLWFKTIAGIDDDMIKERVKYE